MKRLSLLIAVLLSFASRADMQKLAHVQIADMAGLVQAATKAGEFAGYPTLGMMAGMALAGNPVTAEFGVLREGRSVLVLVYADTAKPVTGAQDFEAKCAFLCSPVQDKAAYLAAKGTRTEVDGLIQVRGEGADGEAGPLAYVAFSEDGQWAAKADTPELARKALGEVAAAQRAMAGEFAYACATQEGVRYITSFLDMTSKTMPAKDDALSSSLNMLKMVAGGELALRINDAGLDVHGSVLPVEGSFLDRCGRVPLRAAPFAAAPAGALIATDIAADCGGCGGTGVTYAEQVKALEGIFAKYGLKTDWFTCQATEGTFAWTLDPQAMLAYFQGEGKEPFSKIDPEAFMSDIKALTSPGGEFKTVENAPVLRSLSVVGGAAGTPPGARFAAILPEAAAKSPYGASVCSLYAFIKAVAPVLVNLADDSERAMLSPMLATLPAATDGAVASALWREGKAHGYMLRVSASELRGLSALGNAIFAYAMMRPSRSASVPDWSEDALDGESDDD